MRIIGKTDIGKKRFENQDSFRSGYLSGGFGWGVVCDGMGGGKDGRLASTLAVEKIEKFLCKRLNTGLESEEIKVIIEDSIRRANRDVFRASGNGAVVMGTTAVCAVIRENTLYLAHAGDSRAYLYQEDVLKQLTKDHSMVQELIDNGVLTPEQAQKHPEKNVITRALGVEESIEIEFNVHSILPESLVLLCSDGLSNMITIDSMQSIIKENDFYDMANKLVEAALLAGGFDNITALLIQNHKSRLAREV